MTGSSADRPPSTGELRTRIGAVRRAIGALAATTTERQALDTIADAASDLLTAEARLKRPLDWIELENLGVWLALIESRLEAVRQMKPPNDTAASSPNGVVTATKPGQ